MVKKINKQQDKEIKQTNVMKKYLKITDNTSNKEEDMVKNTQTKDLKMAEKRPQTIPSEMAEKSVENEQTIETKPEIKAKELVEILKIPMQEAQNEQQTESIKETIFEKEKPKDPEFEEEEEEETEEENLNDRYLKDDEDIDSSFFDDEELMAEFGIEIIDLIMTTSAQALAGDFDNPKKYEVSEYKKNKLKKPLKLLLEKRGVKVSPEIMFGVMLLVMYSPIMILAFQERKAKKKKKQQTPDIAEEIPENIKRVDAHTIIKEQQRQTNQTTFETNKIPEVKIEKKKRGRPKGSKDKKQRSGTNYKGNKNA